MSNIQHLYDGVPFHEIMGKDISQMTEGELEALIKTTRAARVSPSERKKLRSTASKELSGKAPKRIKIEEDLSHLL